MEDELLGSVSDRLEHINGALQENNEEKGILRAEALSVASFANSLAEYVDLKSTASAAKVDKGPKISFMTTLDRELFPTKMPQNRFGNEICPLRGAPHRGPGAYENEDKTNFWYDIEHKINSTKGYTLGARTGTRFKKDNVEFLKSHSKLDFLDNDANIHVLERQRTINVYETPSPTAYQINCTELREFDTSQKPFLVGADRFPVYRRDINEVLPGPGVYEHEVKRNRKVQWHQSFGGSPVMMPSIHIRSTIDQNTEKLYSTKEEKKFNRKLAYLKMYY